MAPTRSAEQARLYVVRHAEAGVRCDSPADRFRPLVSEGRARARILAHLLAPAVVGTVLSSPFTRCIQTVEPLAAKSGRLVASCDALAEPADVDAALRVLRALPDGSVACTHGDMLAGLIGAVLDARPRRHRPIQHDKGVVWVLARTAGSLSLIGEIGVFSDHEDRTPSMQDASSDSALTRPDDRRSVAHG